MKQEFEIVSLNISPTKGTRKSPVEELSLIPDFGIVGDAHAGPGNRQISLLASEDIDASRHPELKLGPGAYAENITTRGVDLTAIPVGTRLFLGETELEVTQHGKDCHDGCEIRKLSGDCVMPRRGIFARVFSGGRISCADTGYYHL